MEIDKYSKSRKIILVAGILICLVSVLIILPVERSKSYFITDYIFTYVGLALALLTILYGLTGGYFIKYLTFLILSAVIGGTCWFICLTGDWLQKLVAIWLGVPSGIIAALLFFVLRHYMFFHHREPPVDRRKKNMLFLKQLVLYSVVLLIVSILFFKGGDWIYYFFES